MVTNRVTTRDSRDIFRSRVFVQEPMDDAQIVVEAVKVGALWAEVELDPRRERAEAVVMGRHGAEQVSQFAGSLELEKA